MVSRRANLGTSDSLEEFLERHSVKWCTVRFTDVLRRGKRLDARAFDVEAKQARAMLAGGKYPLVPVGSLASAYVCGRFKRLWARKTDYPIYQPSAITDICPVPDGFLSKYTKTNLDTLRVHKGQVLITCSGTIGKLSYVSRTLDEKIFSHDLLRVDCKDETDAGYLYAFLKSKIGNKILLTSSYGAVITHIEPEHLVCVPMPDAPKNVKREIHQIIARSYKLRDESNDLMDEATALLKKELSLPEMDEIDAKRHNEQAGVDTFSVRLSDWDGRLDASYHVPIAKTIMRHLEQYAEEVTTVGDERVSKAVVLPGRFKRVYVEKGYGRVFIGGKQIQELDPANKKYFSNRCLTGSLAKQLDLQENITLITRSGTIGKVAITPKHWKHWILSEHIIRVVPASEEIAGYLYIFLASDYTAPLIQRGTYGAVVDEIDDTHVQKIPFPLLSNKVAQAHINALALEANEKRYEAYCLEQEALKIMDEKVIFAK